MLPWDEVVLICAIVLAVYLVVRASRRRIRRPSKRRTLRWDMGGGQHRRTRARGGSASQEIDLSEFELDGEGEGANTGLVRTWYSLTIWTTAFNTHCLDYLHPEEVDADANAGSLPLALSKSGSANEVSNGRADEPARAEVGLIRRAYVSAIYASAVPVCVGGMVLAVGVVARSAGASWLDIVTIVQRERVLRRTRLEGSTVMPGVLAGDSAFAEGVMAAAAGLTKRSVGGAGDVAKRAIAPLASTGSLDLPPTARRYVSSSALKPLIPGLTVPISHLLPLLLTLLATQLTHEAGHLLLAALDSIEPVQIVLRVIAGFAGMGVVFGEELEQKSGIKARIAAAGPFNNILSYLLLLSLGVLRVASPLYHDFTPNGRIVLGFAPDSAVRGHIPTHAVVQYVDDLFVGGTRDVWKNYLVGGMQGYLDDSRGWCVDQKRFERSAQAPCPRNAPISFIELPSPSSAPSNTTHCLPAYPLLTTRTWACPCNLASQVCVRPLASEQITRVQWVREDTVDAPKEARESQVMLWKGDRRELYEGIRVSRWAGRGGWTGRWLVEIVEVLFGYLSTISLTLGLLNLLPLAPLDGGHLVGALLDMWYPGTNLALHPAGEDATHEQAMDGAGALTPESREEEKVTEHTAMLPGSKSGLPDLPTRAAPGHSGPPSPALVRRRRRIERGIGWTTGGLVVLALGGLGLTMAFDYMGVGR